MAYRIDLVAAGLRAICLGMCHAICKACQQDQQNGNLHDLARLVLGHEAGVRAARKWRVPWLAESVLMKLAFEVSSNNSSAGSS